MAYHLGSKYKSTQPFGSLPAGTCVELVWAFPDAAQVKVQGGDVLSIPISTFRQHFVECRCATCGA